MPHGTRRLTPTLQGASRRPGLPLCLEAAAHTWLGLAARCRATGAPACARRWCHDPWLKPRENLRMTQRDGERPGQSRPVGATLGAGLVLLAGVGGLFGVVLRHHLERRVAGDGGAAGRLDGVDRCVASWMVEHRASGVTFVARVFSAVGSQQALVPIVAVIALVLIRQQGWRSLGYSASPGAGRSCSTAGPSMPWATASAGRPLADARRRERVSVRARGTVASTFVALAVIAATLASHRLLWTAAAIMLATGVGLSRVYLGVHWATDVIAGWGAAALWVTALVWLFDRVWPLPSRDERGPASRHGPPQARLPVHHHPGRPAGRARGTR